MKSAAREREEIIKRMGFSIDSNQSPTAVQRTATLPFLFEQQPMDGESKGAPYAKVAGLRALADEVAPTLPPQDAGSKTLHSLLKNAPDAAEIWDVVGLTMKACRGVGIPPGVAGVPGKALLVGMFTVYNAARGPQAAAEGAEESANRMGQWTDMSELLSDSVGHMFREYNDMLERQQGAAGGVAP